MLDLDRDLWRLWDSITAETTMLPDAMVLAADFPYPLTIVESCHLRPQSAMSVAHPFTADQLTALRASLADRGKKIRTVNNRRTPRAWAEIEPDIKWEDRPKERDTEIWGRWLLADSKRLESCKYWPEKRERRNSEREAIMRDVNRARQYRSHPKSPYAQEFAQEVRHRLWRAWNIIPWGIHGFHHYVATVFRLGHPARWRILDNPYICDAYCVAVSLETHEPRRLSNRQIRHVCGLNANGYPNQVRADLRHHLHRATGMACTEIDRGFIKIVRALIDLDLDRTHHHQPGVNA